MNWVRLFTELQIMKIFAIHMAAKEIRQKIGDGELSQVSDSDLYVWDGK